MNGESLKNKLKRERREREREREREMKSVRSSVMPLPAVSNYN